MAAPYNFHDLVNRFYEELNSFPLTAVSKVSREESIENLAQKIIEKIPSSSLDASDYKHLNDALRLYTTLRDTGNFTGPLKNSSKIDQVFEYAVRASTRIRKEPTFSLLTTTEHLHVAGVEAGAVDYTSDTHTLSVEKRLSELYGNKTANLYHLDTLFSSEPDISVPPFKGISHDEIFSYLMGHFPLLPTLWKKFIEEGPSPTSARLIEIQEGIRSVFTKAEFPTEEMLAPLLTIGLPLMVRSSGKEDSLEVSNPGGNESLSNVHPDKEKVCSAIGEVLSSYFSSKSLMQRKLMRDDITVLPRLPVLLQVMVGEKKAGPIPISGVIYTRESELDTPGIIQICASPGHAEGVVTGSGACDTFYIEGEHIHGIVNEKLSRRAPSELGGLTAVRNPDTARLNPSLTEKQIQRLALIARRIEASYGHPMDIEWTFDPKENRFYIFQARPIPVKPAAAPSYINPDKVKELQPLQKVTIIGAAGGKALVLSQENVLLSSTAPEALEHYLAHPSTKKTSAVLIGSPTAANSHEAGFFRSLGIPIIQLSKEQYAKIASLLEKQTLLVDTQEAIAGLLPSGAKAEEFLIFGLHRFLAPHTESTVVSTIPYEDMGPYVADLKVIARAVNAKGMNDKLSKLPGWNSLDKLLNGLEKASNPNERAYIVLLILVILETRLLKDCPIPQRNALLTKILYNCRHVLENYNNPFVSEQQRKFALHWLRASLLDAPSQGSLQADSLSTVLGEIKERALLGTSYPVVADPLKKDYLDVFARCAKFILNPTIRKNWVEFLPHLTLNELKDLSQVFSVLGPANTEIILNTYFARSLQIDPHTIKENAPQILRALKELLTEESLASSLTLVKIVKEAAKAFSVLSPEFSHPSEFEALLARVDDELMPAALACCRELEKATGLSHLLLNEAFRHLISAFDDCIKGLTSSPEYTDIKLKAERFHTILERYMDFAEAGMSDTMIAHDPDLLNQARILRSFLKSQLKLFKERLTASGVGASLDLEPAQLLRPSRGFSVAYAALGSSNMAPDRAAPVTLEDYFTTLHQCLLTVSASTAVKSGLSLEDMPAPFKKVHDMVMRINTQFRDEAVRHPTLQFIEYNYPHIRVGYNAPLSNHCAQFVIEGTLTPTGEIATLNFQGNFYASINLGGLGLRTESLSLYALDTYYAGGMTPSDDAKFSQAKTDTTIVSWKLLPAKDDLTAMLSKAQIHLQSMVSFLQIPLDYALSFSTNFTALITDHPEAIHLIYDIFIYHDKLPDVQNFLHAYYISVLTHYNIQNVLELLSLYHRFILERNAKDPALQQLIDRILDDDMLWNSSDKKTINDLSHFLLKMNPLFHQGQYLFSYERHVLNLPPFSIERLNKIRKRLPIIKRAFNVPRKDYFKKILKYQDDYTEFAEFYDPLLKALPVEPVLVNAEKKAQLMEEIGKRTLDPSLKELVAAHIDQLSKLHESISSILDALQTLPSILRRPIIALYLDSGSFAPSMTLAKVKEYLRSTPSAGELAAHDLYSPRTPLGSLYKQALHFTQGENVRSSLESLLTDIKKEDRNTLYGLIWIEHKEPEGDPLWGEHHIFDDPLKFVNALRKLIVLRYLQAPNKDGPTGLDFKIYLKSVEPSTYQHETQTYSTAKTLGITDLEGIKANTTSLMARLADELEETV